MPRSRGKTAAALVWLSVVDNGLSGVAGPVSLSNAQRLDSNVVTANAARNSSVSPPQPTLRRGFSALPSPYLWDHETRLALETAYIVLLGCQRSQALGVGETSCSAVLGAADCRADFEAKLQAALREGGDVKTDTESNVKWPSSAEGFVAWQRRIIEAVLLPAKRLPADKLYTSFVQRLRYGGELSVTRCHEVVAQAVGYTTVEGCFWGASEQGIQPSPWHTLLLGRELLRRTILEKSDHLVFESTRSMLQELSAAKLTDLAPERVQEEWKILVDQFANYFARLSAYIKAYQTRYSALPSSSIQEAAVEEPSTVRRLPLSSRQPSRRDYKTSDTAAIAAAVLPNAPIIGMAEPRVVPLRDYKERRQQATQQRNQSLAVPKLQTPQAEPLGEFQKHIQTRQRSSSAYNATKPPPHPSRSGGSCKGAENGFVNVVRNRLSYGDVLAWVYHKKKSLASNGVPS